MHYLTVSWKNPASHSFRALLTHGFKFKSDTELEEIVNMIGNSVRVTKLGKQIRLKYST